MLTIEPERFAGLVARIRAVVLTVERLRVRPARVPLTEPATIIVKRKEIPKWETRELIRHKRLCDLEDAPGIPARAVNEGTLLVMAPVDSPAEPRRSFVESVNKKQPRITCRRFLSPSRW